MVVVVSEERGTIGFCFNGNIVSQPRRRVAPAGAPRALRPEDARRQEAHAGPPPHADPRLLARWHPPVARAARRGRHPDAAPVRAPPARARPRRQHRLGHLAARRARQRHPPVAERPVPPAPARRLEDRPGRQAHALRRHPAELRRPEGRGLTRGPPPRRAAPRDGARELRAEARELRLRAPPLLARPQLAGRPALDVGEPRRDAPAGERQPRPRQPAPAPGAPAAPRRPREAGTISTRTTSACRPCSPRRATASSASTRPSCTRPPASAWRPSTRPASSSCGRTSSRATYRSRWASSGRPPRASW